MQIKTGTDDYAGFELLTTLVVYMFALVEKLELFNELKTVDFWHFVLTKNKISRCSLIVRLHDCFKEVNCFLGASVVLDGPFEVKLVDSLFETNKIFFIMFDEDDELTLLDKCGVGCHRLVRPHGELYSCIRLELGAPTARSL